MTDSNRYEVAQAQARLITNRGTERKLEVPGKRPGIVIFLHGVNDPGASYESVEKGLCQGLNERLDRKDLRAGVYGAKYAAANSKPKEQRSWEDHKMVNDPDTHLYKRDDIPSHSVLIPFYWGYRAAYAEVKRDAKGDPTKLRTQFQDIHGNRLDANLAKPGGFFVNATNNIPDMYGTPFVPPTGVQWATRDKNYVYVAKAANRRYMVFAAERLATLIATMRTAYPSETITVMGHSQGTVISLLAQALLVDRGQRCADCVIMVASPYSLLPQVTPPASDTLGTLLGIVDKVTGEPYGAPSLDSLRAGEANCHGRTGPAWSAVSGQRIGKDGGTVVFPERDNRGKVYLYFSPNDTTVALDTIAGIGTFGVPDEVGGGRYPVQRAVMSRLANKRFYQRFWTKRLRDGAPVLVGTAPAYQPLRISGEPRYAGDSTAKGALLEWPLTDGQMLHINGEELTPAHAPQMFGGEAVTGTPSTFGKDRPDAVTRNIALGKDLVKLQWIRLPVEYAGMSPAAARAKFNALSSDEDKHTHIVRASGSSLEREQTPEEAREWMESNADALDDNSYHSAVLRDPENHRWVTAMDVAVGQAYTLDNPDWRALLILMADWRLGERALKRIKENPLWNGLDQRVRDIVAWTHVYYKRGTFPPNGVVEMNQLPTLVKGILPRKVPS